jgi:pimeloyl-ACP methyl ester carboxylesterase
MSDSREKRWLRLTAAGLLAVGLPGVAALKAYRAWRDTDEDFQRVPVTFVAPAAVEGHESLKLTTKSGLGIAVSFVPPKNGVAIVMAHGAEASRAQLWPDVQALTAAGYGILALDWPGHGESGGEITLGRPEREAFTACVDFLAARADVKRIAAYGFSQGGALVTLYSADEPRVRSVLAVNAWTDKLDQFRWVYRRWGPLQQIPAVRAAIPHLEGGSVRPIDAAPRLKGRKTLFIASRHDDVVAPQMAAELAAAAGGEVRFIENGTHMNFREAMPGWRGVLTGFFASE